MSCLTTKITFKLNDAVVEKTGAEVGGAVVNTIAFMMVADIKRELYARGRSGEWYFKTKAARRAKAPDHQASAPGEPPAIDTARMANAVMHQAYGSQGRPVVCVGAHDAAVMDPAIGTAYAAKHRMKSLPVKRQEGSAGVNLNYPYFLEVGTRRMKKRPWLRPVYDRYNAAGDQVVKRALAHLAKLKALKEKVV